MLCAFEPVKYCSAAPRLRRRPAAGRPGSRPASSTLDLVSPCAEHALDQAVADERVHERRGRRRTARMSRSPQVSQPRRRLPTGGDVGVRRPLAQVARRAPRRLFVRVGQQVAAGVTLPFLERLEDQRFLLRAHAAERANPAVGRRRFEILERADAELAVERRDGLRPDALQVEQVEDRRRKLGDELAMVLGVAGLGDLADAGGEVLADAGNLAQPGVVERRRARADGWRRCRRRCGRRGS